MSHAYVHDRQVLNICLRIPLLPLLAFRDLLLTPGSGSLPVFAQVDHPSPDFHGG